MKQFLDTPYFYVTMLAIFTGTNVFNFAFPSQFWFLNYSIMIMSLAGIILLSLTIGLRAQSWVDEHEAERQ